MNDASTLPLPDLGVSPAQLLWLLVAALFALALGCLWSLFRNRALQKALEDSWGQEDNQEALLQSLLQSQSEISGRMQTMAEVFGTRQADLVRVMNDRIDGMGRNLGTSLLEGSKHTQENLRNLAERLAVLDTTRKTMGDLASQVGDLRALLSNKQARGAYGQRQMEAIIADALPPSSYSFQGTLSNGTRPDTLINMPSNAPALVVDAKFPLEASQLVQRASTREEQRLADAEFRRHMLKHVSDISQKYLLPGETQDTALMFVPSESLFALLHERFPELVQRALRQGVVIVSPSLLMLAIQVIRSVLRDANLQEHAHTIQVEVVKLIEDVARLEERASKLQNHFSAAQKDRAQLEVSLSKISSRAKKIAALDMGVPANTPENQGEGGALASSNLLEEHEKELLEKK
ncbi:DNA recombination protein RmuC [Polycladidibacter hongkongensis]|uniref:DNA recombination protein RmuC n=1 Tax=Polycladidibacter hongkongensis TaxID=1647556 RepID=UPI00083180E0|nr:DNA recombination protein RmuC [Pseudovibrio hongkongensis]